AQLLSQARHESPPSPRSLNRAIPKPLDAICLKAMAFHKKDRYASASALAEDLQRYLAGEPVAAYRETLLERTWRWCRRHRQFLGWCAAGLLVLATALFGWAKWREAERQREEDRIEAERQREEDRLQAEKKQREIEERRQAAQCKAEELQKKNQARAQITEFRRLADEMRFYAAVPDPAGDQAPPFYDLENGERKGRDALAIVTDWGPALADLPLAEEQDPVKSELYDLLLLMAQT